MPHEDTQEGPLLVDPGQLAALLDRVKQADLITISRVSPSWRTQHQTTVSGPALVRDRYVAIATFNGEPPYVIRDAEGYTRGLVSQLIVHRGAGSVGELVPEPSQPLDRLQDEADYVAAFMDMPEPLKASLLRVAFAGADLDPGLSVTCGKLLHAISAGLGEGLQHKYLNMCRALLLNIEAVRVSTGWGQPRAGR